MANCGHYLGYALEQTNGSTWVVQTLDAQFLSAILQSDPWIPHMNPGLVKHFLLPLTTILPKYLMYTSVLRAVSRAMRKVRSLGLESGSAWCDLGCLDSIQKIGGRTPGGFVTIKRITE
jgi:hypothetical protein